METSRSFIRKRFEETIWKIGDIFMSYDKNTESMLSFILPTIQKQELEDICIKFDRNQSQVLRDAVSSYIRFAQQQYMEKQEV